MSIPTVLAQAMRLTRRGRVGEAATLVGRSLLGAPDRGAASQPSRQGRETPPPEPEVRTGAAVPPLPWLPAGGVVNAGLAETLRRLSTGEAPLHPRRPSQPIPDGAQFLLFSHASAEGSREYKLYVPSALPQGPLPLVVMLHGCNQDPDDFAAGTGMNRLAEMHGLLVAYPGQSPSANARRCWNWFRPENQRRGGEPALIAGIVEEIAARYAVDGDRVYAAGLSAGGSAAAILGAAYPDVFAAVGVHSGLPVGAAWDVASAYAAMRRAAPALAGRAKVPTIVFHGDSDATVDPDNAAEVVAQAAAGHRVEREEGMAEGRRYTRAVHRDAAGRTVAEHWSVHGGGHAWSGGDPAGSYADPQGPDASAEMLRFFLGHRR